MRRSVEVNRNLEQWATMGKKKGMAGAIYTLPPWSDPSATGSMHWTHLTTGIFVIEVDNLLEKITDIMTVMIRVVGLMIRYF